MPYKMMLVVYTWILCIVYNVFASNLREHCPDIVRNSKHYIATRNKTCYMFVNKEKFWDEARSYCWHMGGEMLKVDSISTMQFIQGHLNSAKLGWGSNGVWNGASDLRDRGWEWTTGENLKFTFWADGEPGKFLGLISLENCALMRRSDNWRWHDYHCHMSPYEYNFICQFPFVYGHQQESNLQHQDHGAPITVTDDTAAMIALITGGVALIVVMCTVIFFLHNKHQRQKALLKQSRPVIRYQQNTAYASIVQSREGSSSQLLSARPTSNMYLEPSEVTRIYEEVAKNSIHHGRNNLQNTDETARLVYHGEAASVENLEENGYLTPTMSSASGVTSGYCSSNNVGTVDNSEYLEMSAPNRPQQIANDLANTYSSGASGDPSDLKNNGSSQNAAPKCSNLYVTACPNGASQDKQINKQLTGTEKSDKPEIHIYTNQMETLDNLSMRPLPPVPDFEKPLVTLETA